MDVETLLAAGVILLLAYFFFKTLYEEAKR